MFAALGRCARCTTSCTQSSHLLLTATRVCAKPAAHPQSLPSAQTQVRHPPPRSTPHTLPCQTMCQASSASSACRRHHPKAQSQLRHSPPRPCPHTFSYHANVPSPRQCSLLGPGPPQPNISQAMHLPTPRRPPFRATPCAKPAGTPPAGLYSHSRAR